MQDQDRATPAAEWREAGEQDPHGNRYDCKREQLTLGQLSDDQLANAAFMGYDRPLDIKRLLSDDKSYFTPVMLMAGVKDRIRWLSRRTVALEQQRDELLRALRDLETAANTVLYCYDKRPEKFASALEGLRVSAEAARNVGGRL